MKFSIFGSFCLILHLRFLVFDSLHGGADFSLQWLFSSIWDYNFFVNTERTRQWSVFASLIYFSRRIKTSNLIIRRALHYNLLLAPKFATIWVNIWCFEKFYLDNKSFFKNQFSISISNYTRMCITEKKDYYRLYIYIYIYICAYLHVNHIQQALPIVEWSDWQNCTFFLVLESIRCC